MKNIFASFIVFFSVLSVVRAERLISVNGTSSRMVEPNLMRVEFEVWGKASDSKSAQKLAAKQAEDFRATLKEKRIKSEDMQTQYLNVGPEYTWDNSKQKLVGYRATQNFSVIFRDLKAAGPAIDALIVSTKANDHGVNLNGSTLDSDRKAEAQSEALADAVNDAKQKAEAIAKAAGVKIKWLYRVNYSAPNYEYTRANVLASSMQKGMMAEAAPATQIDPGLMKVSVELTAEYEIN